jgi:hypothetical protein
MTRIGSYSIVEKLDLGENIWAYRFETSQGPVWILWFDDGELYLPGMERPSVAVRLNIEADQVLLTWTPTEAGQVEPESQSITISGGVATFELGLTPLFLTVTD